MIKKNSSVTVLTATYNSEPYIHECVASVMNQTYSHWHMYVLDDGSTDNTVAIASNYAKKDSRITVVQFPHTVAWDPPNIQQNIEDSRDYGIPYH